jgi:hypothetical protein
MPIIDLSAPIAPSPPDAAPFDRVEIRYRSHGEGAAQIQGLLGVPPGLLRDGEGWAIEEFGNLGTHNVTHVDAPWHYNSRIRGSGRPRWTSCRWSGSSPTASSST